MTGREKVIGGVTAALLAAAVGFVVYGAFTAGGISKEVDAVSDELLEMYSPGSGRPDPISVRIHLGVPTEDNVPEFPTPRGIRMQSFGMTDDGVTIVFRGTDRAAGQCFRVAYTDDGPAEVGASSTCP